MVRRQGILTLRREDGRIVCEEVKVADTLGRRLVGLLGRSRIRHEEGVVLRPSFSIHTAFMRFPIDAVFLDHNLVVLQIAANLRPFRTAACRGAREVVELAAGECARRGLEVGDRVTWAPLSQPAEGSSAEPLPAARPYGSVVVVSSDARFAKLVRFLLNGRDIGVAAVVAPDELAAQLEDEIEVDVVVLDVGAVLADGLRTANATRSLRPDVVIVMAGEGVADRASEQIRIYHRWDETAAIVDAVEEALRSKDEKRTGPMGLLT